MISNTRTHMKQRPAPSPRRTGRSSGGCTALVAAAAAAFVVVLCPRPSRAFVTPTCAPVVPSGGRTTDNARRQLSMIGNIFGGGGGGGGGDPQLPRDVKDAISKCRGAVQKGLEDRISRMDVEMPVGANFGIENNKSSKSKRAGGNLSSLTEGEGGDGEMEEGLTMEKLETSNRELARLFVEMFQPLGGRHIAAVFNDEYLAGEARKRWSNDLSAECNVVAIDRKGKRNVLTGRKGGGKKKKKAARGFAAKMAEEMEDEQMSSGPFNLPPETEVAIFVAPGARELIAIERICDEVGMGTCVILLNARLSLIDKYASDDARRLFEGFEPVWSLTAASQEEAPGCLIHRAYPGPWVLARKPVAGPPKTIALKDGAKFSGEECAEAYGNIEVSDLEKGTEKLAGNLAGWFK